MFRGVLHPWSFQTSPHLSLVSGLSFLYFFFAKICGQMIVLFPPPFNIKGSTFSTLFFLCVCALLKIRLNNLVQMYFPIVGDDWIGLKGKACTILLDVVKFIFIRLKHFAFPGQSTRECLVPILKYYQAFIFGHYDWWERIAQYSNFYFTYDVQDWKSFIGKIHRWFSYLFC